MIPSHKCIITGGGTKAYGEIRIWQDLEADHEGLGLYCDREAQSVYAVTISPTGKYLAAGSKTGLVRIWPFLGLELKENTPFMFEIYHQLCPVTALAFLTDDILLSAGINGKIRVISLSQEKSLTDINAHSAPICSLLALGSRVVTSLGIDGKIKIWDMDSLSCAFERKGFLFPQDSFSLFPMLAFSENAGCLYSPSSNGVLHIFDLQNLSSHTTIQAHQDAFYAMTTCGKYLLTGGMDDQKLKLWNTKTLRPEKELGVGASLIRLCSIGDTKAVAICHEPDGSQNLRLFEIPELQMTEVIQGLDLRSITSVPLSTFLERETIELNQWKEELIDQARSKIKDPVRMVPILKQLVERGFWADATLLQADSAKLRNKPLHELGFLLQLTENIKLSERTWQIFYRLARLLEQLNEPGLAAKFFESLKPFSAELESIIQRLEAHPLNNLDQNITARSDIAALSLATQEMEKDTVLGRLFPWRLIIPSRKPQVFVIKALHSLDLWARRIQEVLSGKGIKIQMTQEKAVIFDGINIRELTWLKIPQMGIRWPSPYLDYAIEIDQENGQARGHGIFNPQKNTTSIDNAVTYNVTLSQTYQSLYQKKEVENWLSEVHIELETLDTFSSYKTNSN